MTLPAAVPVGDIVALTVPGNVLSFNRATPAALKGSIAVSNLQANEKLVGLDTRPATGLLYALSDLARIHTLNAATGVATFRTALSAAAGDDNPYTALISSQFGVGFNPFADRLRVISNTGLNMRIGADTGAATTGGVINRAGAPPMVAGGAYSNSFAGARSTVLYDLDAASPVLAQQVPPNDSTLVNIGALTVPLQVRRRWTLQAVPTAWCWPPCAPLPPAHHAVHRVADHRRSHAVPQHHQ